MEPVLELTAFFFLVKHHQTECFFGAFDGQETYFFSVDAESPAAPEEFSTETGYERAEHPPDMPEMEPDANAESEDQGGHSTWDGMGWDGKGWEDERLNSRPAACPTFPGRAVASQSFGIRSWVRLIQM